MKIHVAHSPDSDDAFMFYALAEGLIERSESPLVLDADALNALVADPELPLEPLHAVGHRIEKAAILLHLGEPRLDTAAIAEQPLEDDARVALVRDRRVRSPPRRRVHVGAAIPVLARAHQEVGVGGQLK